MQLLRSNDYSPSSDRTFYRRDTDAPHPYDAVRESRKCIVSRRPGYIQVTQTMRDSSQIAGATHLSILDQLPNEVITAILQYCTVRTLLSPVLRVNHAAYAIAKHLPGLVSVTETLRGNLSRFLGAPHEDLVGPHPHQHLRHHAPTVGE
ncbi:hypothetical protein PG994_015084 [Apiospora phragmitis]|uniref:F-box domain-containing protein n=1 Tax=Apiospora phragmitis TaxID=2905665 RepID=A0ABR1SVS8_9PEZI